MIKKFESFSAIFISSLLFAFCALSVYLAEVELPEKLLAVTGPITNLTPIYSDKAGTRFRFCMGTPVQTFTYQGPAPGIERAWSALNSARRASVLYAPGQDRTLWQLEVEGSFLVTTAELRNARMQHLLILLVGLLVSGAVAANGIVQALRKRVKTSQ
jgi:hypothetical protein